MFFQQFCHLTFVHSFKNVLTTLDIILKSSLLVEAKREQIFGFDVTECIFGFLQVANLSEIPLSHETI